MRSFALFVLLSALVLPPASRTARAAQGTNSSSNSDNAVPLSPQARAMMHADALMAAKDYALAAVAYQDIVHSDPKDAVLLNKIGIAFQQLQDAVQSERYYKKAIKADKKFASAVNNLGTLEYGRKRYGKAIKAYKKSLELDSTNASAYSNLGYAYYATKQYPEAMQAFTKALALDPQIFDRRGGFGAVVQQRSAPDPGMFYFVLAKFYAKAGDAERAAHYLKLSRDDGYKDFANAAQDPDFALVIKDPRVQDVLHVLPSYADDAKKTDAKPAVN